LVNPGKSTRKWEIAVVEFCREKCGLKQQVKVFFIDNIVNILSKTVISANIASGKFLKCVFEPPPKKQEFGVFWLWKVVGNSV